MQLPFGVAVDGNGNLYIADYGNARIRKVSRDGIIGTVAGNGTGGFSGDGGPATDAQLSLPVGVAVDGAGDVFIADYNNRRVRKISPNGIITTAAGDGTCCSWFSGDNGPATSAPLIGPLGVAVDSSGNLFLADYGRIRKISTSGIITTVASGGTLLGVAVDGAGDLFVADALFNTRIRKVSSNGIITTIAGSGAYCCFSGDSGPALNAQLNDPAGVALDGNGNLYIADARNSRIRKVSPDGAIATVANACGSPDDVWAACGIAVDRAGNFYASNDGGTFKISPDGSQTKLADHGLGLAVDGAGNLFIADQYNSAVLKGPPG
jgi:sugar lactone lactonase YvrE